MAKPLTRQAVAFTGGLNEVAIDVSGELTTDEKAEFRSAMAHQ